MLVLLHTLFMATFVGMTRHFWRQIPLEEDEVDSERLRDFIAWSCKGVGVPVLLWFLLNLGLTSWLPPYLSAVDDAKNSGGFWLGTALTVVSPAMSVIVSYWAAISFLTMVRMIWQRTEDRGGFRTTLLVWGCFMIPVSAVILLIGGWAAAGFAVVVWLAPVVKGAIPSMEKTKRAPSYSQAIAKMKFGKYAEAELEVVEELERCENDFNGWMMLAELYAVHFRDFKQAEQTVIDLCDQPEIKPSDACVALHRLADWFLQLQNDPQGARRCMEAISKRHPNTHLDRMARVRLKSIPHTPEELADEHQRTTYHLPALHDELDEPTEIQSVDAEAVRNRAELLSQKLARDPNDAHAREEFSRSLVLMDKRDAAIDQLDLLLEMEGQPANRRAEWTGLKANWVSQRDPKDPEVRKLLEHIVQQFPETPQALAARRRILLMDEQIRLAKYAGKRPKPRFVVRLDEKSE